MPILGPPSELAPTGFAARKFRVPVKWLNEEAEAGRIPHVAAGKRKLFHLPTLEKILIERAKGKEVAQ